MIAVAAMDNWAGLVVSVGLIVFMVLNLLHPERF